jgi:flagellar protein FlaJ
MWDLLSFYHHYQIRGDNLVKSKNYIKKTQKNIHRLISTGEIQRLIMYIITIIPSLILIILSMLNLIGIIQPLSIGGLKLGTWIDYIIIAAVISSGTYGIYEYLRIKRIRKIDERFPDFVHDLAELRRAGMTFPKAILTASKGSYGFLTSEIQKIAKQISWGSSVEDALKNFAQRVNTKLVNRTVSLIIEASHSGGNVADVLEVASKDARELKLIASERRASILSYVAVVYVGFGVFLLIIIVLCSSLLPALLSSGGMQAGLGRSGGITLEAVTSVFFFASLIQSYGMGIVTGVFEEGKMVSGLKHSFIMLVITWIVFKTMVGV